MKKLERQTLPNTAIAAFNPSQSRNDLQTGTCDMIVRTDPANTGTIRFQIETELAAPTDLSAQYPVPAGEKLYLSLGRGQRMYAQASAAGQSFWVEY
jgi:hypothetical protein